MRHHRCGMRLWRTARGNFVQRELKITEKRTEGMEENEILQKAIEKIGEFNRFGSKPGLERISALLSRLGNPQEKLRIIHVGGTNGKGSVCRYVYSVLQACGYKTGLFTSPYLESFTERIEFNGRTIDPRDLLRIGESVIGKTKEMTEAQEESPTEFEVVTAIALCYFLEKGADYVVLEVGLGGRGDATNIAKKTLVSAITSISYDHTDYLGNTLEQIAWEKAGIIKEGGCLVSSVKPPEAKEVIRRICGERNARFYDVSQTEFQVKHTDLGGSVFQIAAGDAGGFFCGTEEITISMAGRHQIQNAVCALKILTVLLEQENNIRIPLSRCLGAMEAARQKGRIEMIKKDPCIILDGAHNGESAEALVSSLMPLLSGKRVLIVAGILKDKDMDAIVSPLVRLGMDFIATEPENPRKLAASALAEQFCLHGAKGEVHTASDWKQAMELALSGTGFRRAHDVILFTGSLYLIGGVRKVLCGGEAGGIF